MFYISRHFVNKTIKYLKYYSILLIHFSFSISLAIILLGYSSCVYWFPCQSCNPFAVVVTTRICWSYLLAFVYRFPPPVFPPPRRLPAAIRMVGNFNWKILHIDGILCTGLRFMVNAAGREICHNNSISCCHMPHVAHCTLHAPLQAGYHKLYGVSRSFNATW